MPEPTMRDLFNMLQNCPSKHDLEAIKTQIVESNNETIAKVDDIARRTDTIEDTQYQHAEKIQMLEINLELLKQENLKNNICVSGIPPAMIKKENGTSKIIISIAKYLGVDVSASQFTSYAVAGNKFVIIHFYNMSHKQLLINKIRIKKSLMVEEVFQQNQSNSQIYLNDHLTPYFNKLYLMARNAKKDGKLASATSFGGKIRARKSEDDIPTLITHEQQLLALINDDVSDMSFSTVQQSTNTSIASTTANVSPSTSHNSNQGNDNARKPKNSERSTRHHGASTSRGTNNSKDSADSRVKNNRQHNNKNNKGKRLLDTSGNADGAPKKSKVQQRNAK